MNPQRSASTSSKGPGKNVLILGSLCVALIAGLVAYKIAANHRENLVERQKTALGVSFSASGTQDTSQIIAGALADAQINTLGATATNPFAVTPNDTMTDRISKQLFTSYLQSQQADGDITADSAAAIADDLVNNNIDVSQLPKQNTYTYNQTRIVAGSSKTPLQQYGNAVAAVIRTNFLIVSNNKARYSNDLIGLATIYKNIGAQLMTQPVPADLAQNHLILANSYAGASEAMKMISDQAKDPVKALLGVKTFKETGQVQAEIYTDLAQYFQTNGILFDSSEPGSLWNSFLVASTTK